MKKTISAILSLLLAASALTGCTAQAPVTYEDSIRPMAEYNYYVDDSTDLDSGWTECWNPMDDDYDYSYDDSYYSGDALELDYNTTITITTGVNDRTAVNTARVVNYPTASNAISCKNKEEILKAISKASLNLEPSVAVKSSSLPTSNEIFNAMANSNCLRTSYSGDVTTYYFEYPSGVKVAQAYKSGNTSKLNSDEKKLLENAKKIISENTSKANTALQNEQAIHDYIVKHTKYVDNGESSQTAIGAINNGEAVCAGYADAFNMFMKMLGYDCCYVSGVGTTSVQSGPHAWNIIKIDGKYKHVDVCWDDPIGRTSSTVRQTYFNISADEISKNHTWAKEYYPA